MEDVGCGPRWRRWGPGVRRDGPDVELSSCFRAIDAGTRASDALMGGVGRSARACGLWGTGVVGERAVQMRSVMAMIWLNPVTIRHLAAALGL